MCNTYRVIGLWIFLSCLILSGGCGGGSQASVAGKVTFDGQPVENGLITFVPSDKSKGPTAGASIMNGNYKIEGTNLPSPGTYRVEIAAKIKTGKQIPAGSPSPPGTMIDQTIEGIPLKYNKNSTLTQELKAGQNSCDFALTSK